jgi:hypothetical protein
VALHLWAFSLTIRLDLLPVSRQSDSNRRPADYNQMVRLI